jgi:hypothetical protein
MRSAIATTAKEAHVGFPKHQNNTKNTGATNALTDKPFATINCFFVGAYFIHLDRAKKPDHNQQHQDKHCRDDAGRKVLDIENGYETDSVVKPIKCPGEVTKQV